MSYREDESPEDREQRLAAEADRMRSSVGRAEREGSFAIGAVGGAYRDWVVAAEAADWEQVFLNHDEPCFFLSDARFCLRGRRWGGHDDDHAFVSLASLVRVLLGSDSPPIGQASPLDRNLFWEDPTIRNFLKLDVIKRGGK